MMDWKVQYAEWNALRTRGEIKRSGKAIDATLEQKIVLVEYLTGLGHDVSLQDSGKKLLRVLLDRSKEAQIRKNPIHRNESFECIFCGQKIELPIVGIRDHCPRCLRGRHVDIVPGDRAAECKGRLEPTHFELVGGVVWIDYRCTMCTHTYRVRAHTEDRLPHSLSISDLPKRLS